MKGIKYILFFLFFGWSTFYIVGQESNFKPSNLKFKHISTKEGLSQSSGIDILQDSKGYLWFGTRDGLNKFDGTKFQIYRHNSEDANSLSHSWVTSILEDTYGNLWIGTKDGLNRYNANNDNFTRYKFSSEKESISDNEIWDLIQLNETDLWVATNNGIDVINIQTNKITHFKHFVNNSNSIRDNRVRCFLKTKSDNLFIATIEGVCVYNPKLNNFNHLAYPKNVVKEKHVNNSPVLFEDKYGQIWMGYGEGLAIFNSKNNAFETYEINNKPLLNNAVRTIAHGYGDNLWVGSYIGLFILNTKQVSVDHFVHNENNSKSLSHNSIYKILKDSRGDMWIGTWAGGINFFDRSYDNFKLISAGAHNGMLNYKVISSIIENSEDEWWIGTEGGGLNVYNKKTGTFKYYTNKVGDKNSLSSNNIKSILKDHNGNFWIGTHDGGLNFLNPLKKPYKFQRFETSNSNGIDINDYRILKIFEDINYNIWIGTLTGGLIKYNPKSKIFTKIHNTQKSIIAIEQSSNKDEIIIGGSEGIEKVNIQTNLSQPIIYKPKESNLNNAVNCILVDENNYWIGTEGQGLYLYNTATDKTTKYGIAEGLPNEVIYGILSNKDNLWISTNDGLSKFNISTKSFTNFDEFDGLQGNEFNYNSYTQTSAGELLFGGTNGLNYFNPTDIVENNFIPSVDIYALKVSNKPFLKITDSVSEITLKHNQNDFSFDFTALSYSQPNKNNFAYKLEGFDPDWNYIGNNKTANYTNLDEGNYTFRVKASNNNGLWNEKGDAIKVSILPAPWRTWWAYLIYLGIVLTLIHYFRKLALTRIKERNELKQEKLEKEKIAEVNKLKLQLFTNISHDFRTPLTLIIGPIEKLLSEKHNNPLIQRNLETIHRNTNILLQLINELLDFRKSDDGKLKLYASKSNIIPFIENIKLSFEELAIQRNIDYQLNFSQKDIEMWFDKVKVKKILFNLLSNAFKFTTKNGKLLLNISTEKNNKNNLIEEYIRIDVINFGAIIPPEHIEFIFDRFYQVDKSNVQSGTGIGLSLTKSLVELHKGKINVTSSTKYGTCFSVLLPLGKNHLLESECVNDVEKSTSNQSFEKPIYVQKELLNEEIKINQTKTDVNHDLPSLLIVEDNHEVRNFIKNIFIYKYNIFEADNGKTALELAENKHVDLIVSDIMMPIMNGFELCTKIKTNITTSHIPIILLTAKTSPIHKKQGYKIGADAYITKPFDANILEVRVNNLIKSRNSLISKFKKDIILEPKELTVTTADEKFLEKAIEIVENSISDVDFNVNVFTEKMNMSRSVLYRKFKAITDQSISEFVRTIKLKRAGQLLSQTDMNVSEIAYEVGFNDLKYFRKVFKKQFNELPSKYRADHSKRP